MASYGSLVINDGVGDGSSPGLSSFSLNISCSSPPVFVGSTPKRTIRYSTKESTDTRPGQSVSFRLAHDRVVAGSLSGRIVLDGSAIQTFAVDIGGNFSFSDIGARPRKVSSGSLDLASGVVSLFYGSSSSSSSSSEVLQTSLIVDYIYEETVSSFRMTNTFSKRIDRIASSKNPMKAAKSAVAEYAGCREASMVRKRAVALSRIRLSISGEEFRFRLP